jgi:hypothetical protein
MPYFIAKNSKSAQSTQRIGDEDAGKGGFAIPSLPIGGPKK